MKQNCSTNKHNSLYTDTILLVTRRKGQPLKSQPEPKMTDWLVFLGVDQFSQYRKARVYLT